MTRTLRNSSALRTGALLAGVGLAASFLYVRAKTRQVEREHPPAGRFVEVDGVRLHYVERGEGPASFSCTATAYSRPTSRPAACWNKRPNTTA